MWRAGWVILCRGARGLVCGESDGLGAEKVRAAGREGLAPSVGVGETLAEREAGQTLAVVEAQLAAVLDTLADIAGQARPARLRRTALILVGRVRADAACDDSRLYAADQFHLLRHKKARTRGTSNRERREAFYGPLLGYFAFLNH